VTLTPSDPMLLELNVRLGDPEAQVLIMRLMSDLLPPLIAARDGVLKSVDLRWRAKLAVCVVMAASGYPSAAARSAVSPPRRQTPRSRSFTPAPAACLPRRKPGATGCWPTAAACSTSPPSAPISRGRASAPMPQSTRSGGPKASGAAISPPRAEFAARREDTAKIALSDRSATGSAAPSL
jgi:hypothetical protein